MNFFAHQELARKQTRLMLVLFTMAVVCIVVAVDVVVIFLFGLKQDPDASMPSADLTLVIGTSVAVLVIMGCASLYRISTLRAGGSAVAIQLGATPVTSDTTDFVYRRLRNVVEEIAIASGVPVPEIFVLEEESAINAFASGYTPADAAVTVTRGCLDKLTREELQGIIAHEFSHILNGDMRLNIRLMGVAFGILVIAIVGRKIAESSGRTRSSVSGGIIMIGVALLVVGYIGVFFSRLIKASISRQREYLADASAVQFTRQTDGIAGALKKIGGLAEGSKLAHGHGEEVAHMLFGDGVGYSALFATHPAVNARIKRLQPHFNAKELSRIAREWSNPRRVGELDDKNVSISGFAPAHLADALAPIKMNASVPHATATLTIDASHVACQVGNPDTDDYAAAYELSMAIPLELTAAARAQNRAMALIFGLLMANEDSVRAAQELLIEQCFDVGTRELVSELNALISRLHPMQRLPLAAMAFPALRRRPRPQLDIFLAAIRRMIDADGRVSLDEYCLAKLIGIQVMDALNPAATRVIGRIKLIEVVAEISDLFSVVAALGHADEASARRAYILGMHEVLPDIKPSYAPPAAWAHALDRALPRLDRLAPQGKELVVRGLTKAISADGVVSVSESELLRTICASLHCPLPPLLHS